MCTFELRIRDTACRVQTRLGHRRHQSPLNFVTVQLYMRFAQSTPYVNLLRTSYIIAISCLCIAVLRVRFGHSAVALICSS